jgi:hypothetical protein
MFARLVTASAPVENLDEIIQLWREVVPPSAREREGFRNARLLVDRQSGKIASMGLWESEAALMASVEWNAEQLARFTSLLSSVNVGVYELVEDIRALE